MIHPCRLRALHIARAARNYVDVSMVDRLPGFQSVVNVDVE